ncbi:MAG TPA: HD domain-containing protein [Candidatus Onthocola stercoravium]|nr:HD domain-containing protein [Candidatus Onthocola stercoravium]
MNVKLQEYLENEIMPRNDLNDEGHNREHVNYVRRRSKKFASNIDGINMDMVDTIAVYHDVGHSIDAKNHEKVSASILASDKNLREFFSEEEIKVMAEAVEDHRASKNSEPRSIYGRIVSSADRNTSVDQVLKRTYSYRLKHMPDASIDEIIEESRKHAIDKFGVEGYAVDKMYFSDDEYEVFLKKIQELAGDLEGFRRRYIEVNEINFSRVRKAKEPLN